MIQTKTLEERVALIEAFLDKEMRERQHLVAGSGSFSHGLVNPWFGACLEPFPVHIRPMLERAVRIDKAPIRHEALSALVDEAHSVQGVEREAAIRCALELQRIFSGQKHEGRVESGWQAGRVGDPVCVERGLSQGASMRPAGGPHYTPPIPWDDCTPSPQALPTQVEELLLLHAGNPARQG